MIIRIENSASKVTLRQEKAYPIILTEFIVHSLHESRIGRDVRCCVTKEFLFLRIFPVLLFRKGSCQLLAKVCAINVLFLPSENAISRTIYCLL